MKTKKLYESKAAARNEERYGITATSCICCNKPTNEDFFVHMSTEWEVIPALATDEILQQAGIVSQGLFPIGSSCAKKMGDKYIILA